MSIPQRRHLDFKLAQRIKENYAVKGLLGIQIRHPFEIQFTFCPEIWELPPKFLQEIAKIPNPLRIKGIPIQNIPYTLKWIDTEIGQDLITLWDTCKIHSTAREFLAKVMSMLYHPDIGPTIVETGVPKCGKATFELWHQSGHPIYQAVATSWDK